MAEEKLRITARVAFTDYLKTKKLRKTPERYAILDKVFDVTEHFDVDTLCSSLEEDSYHVSKATVYNTMELLVNCGLVRRHQFGPQPAQYERVAGMTNHLHLVCTQCRKIKEVKDPELVNFMNARRYPSFAIAYFALYVYGLCASCSRKNKREKAKEIKK